MVLEDAANMAKADEMLSNPQVVGTMDSEKYLALCIAAGYSKETASKAASDWGLERLRRDLPA